jgi:glycerophosphoryl diester phosphodiesterase
MPTGAETVLRTAPGDAGTTPPEPPDAAAPEERGGGWSRRRLIGVGGAVALVGIIVAVALLVFGGSNGGPPRAAGHSTAAQSAINGTKTSAAAASSGLSGTTSSSSSVTTPGFAPISRVLAHAGGNEGFPEETLPAFLQAAHRGFTVESDVRWTKDGVPVFNHDTTTGLGMICSGGPYVVAETNWAVLRDRCATPPSASKTHRSYGIPTFDTAVQQLSQIPGATLFAELKVDPTPAQSRQYLQILRRWDMLSRTVVTSYVSSYLTHFDAEAAREGVRIRTLRFANTGSPTTLADLQQLHVWGASFQEPWDRIPTLIAGARRAGIHVGIETSPKWDDGPAHWSEAKRLGAEFLITSKPSAYSAWLDQHG